jgi:hypothetical protein
MYYNEIKYSLYIHILVHVCLLSSECQVQLQRPYTVSIPYLAVTYVLYCFDRPGSVVGGNITFVLCCYVTS